MALFGRGPVLALLFVVSGCSNDGSSAGTRGGAGNVGGAAGVGGSGGTSGAGDVVIDGGLDGGLDVTGFEDAADGGDGAPTAAVLLDDIFGGPMIDGGPIIDAGLLRAHLPIAGNRVLTWQVDVDASPAWPVRYAFDTGLEGWTLILPGPGEPRPIEAIVHSDDDAKGATDSGSLELRTWFAPYETDASRQYPSVIRAFSIEGEAPQNWEGYRVVATAKSVPGLKACLMSAVLYVKAGAERKVLNSQGVYLSTQEWRPIVLDLEAYRSFGDTTQIFEFGIEISHGLCVPP